MTDVIKRGDWDTDTKEKPGEDIKKRWPSTNQEE